MLSFCNAVRGRDVLITGVGAVCPLGMNLPEIWSRLLAGESACRRLHSHELPGGDRLPATPGFPLNGAFVNHALTRQQFPHLPLTGRLTPNQRAAVLSEPVLTMTAVALHEAASQAGLVWPMPDAGRVSVLFGGSKGGLATAERLVGSLRHSRRAAQVMASSRAIIATTDGSSDLGCWNEPDTSQPVMCRVEDDFSGPFEHAFTTDSAARIIAQMTGAEGPQVCPVAACATGLISVLQGAAMIHSGQSDLCIVGSADAALRASVVSSFNRLQVLSRQTEAAHACRPFDRDRDGFVIGDGAAVLILESRRHARRRGARPLAQVLGGGWLCDPTGITQIDESGRVIAELLQRSAAAIGHAPHVLSVHGTGTESNDLAEGRGIQRAFEANLPVCFGIKGASGHLLGAAGSLETAVVAAGIRSGSHPGTRNFHHADPRCLIPIAAQPRPVSPRAVWGKISLGFGGHAACGLFGSG